MWELLCVYCQLYSWTHPFDSLTFSLTQLPPSSDGAPIPPQQITDKPNIMDITFEEEPDSVTSGSFDSMQFNMCQFALTKKDITSGHHLAILDILLEPNEWNLREPKDDGGVYHLWTTMYPRQLADFHVWLERNKARLGFEVKFTSYVDDPPSPIFPRSLLAK